MAPSNLTLAEMTPHYPRFVTNDATAPSAKCRKWRNWCDQNVSSLLSREVMEGRGNGGMEEIALRGAKWFVLLTQNCMGDKMEKNEMGWACGAYGMRRRVCIWSWMGNWRERDHWGNLGVDAWIILGWISRRWDVCIWTGLGWPRMETVGGGLWVR